jgi:tetratricopeptide (TPR) repeat protein
MLPWGQPGCPVPEGVEARLRRAALLDQQGRRDEALAHYQEAVRLQPDHPEARLRLGIALAERGRRADGLTHLEAAARLRPGCAQAQYNLGVALAEEGRPVEALASFREAARLRPDYAAAHYAAANVLGGQGRHEEAVAGYRRAVQAKADYGEAYNNLGLALLEVGRRGEAVVLLRQALRLRPQAPEAQNNLGLALAALGRFAEAETCYHEALRLNPSYAEAHDNLAAALQALGRHEEALAAYDLALTLQPESASVHWNRALALLQRGDFERGWAEYEWRWRRSKAMPRRLPGPTWDSAPLGGRTLLIYMEQGLGDMIQFLRFAPLVQRQGGRVVVECPGPLLPLFATCRAIDHLVAEGTDLPPFDVHAPLLSLPHRLGTTLATVPADCPYLAADPARSETWARALAPVRGFRVGIVWQGNPRHVHDHHRSVPLARFAPLAGVPGVRLISLQKGAGVEQLHTAQAPLPVVELEGERDAAGGFLDTAAILTQLDLVVTVDTSVAHLAGALGVPVWVALSALPDWRWLLGRDDSPWYPTMRLFRQRTLGDWGGVFRHLARELRRQVSQPRPAPGTRVS